VSFWQKMFGKKADNNTTSGLPPWPKDEPLPSAREYSYPTDGLQGGPTEFGDAHRLAAQGRWEEAMAIADRILALPGGVEPGKERLLNVLRDKSPIRLDHQITGNDSSGQHVGVINLRLGGDAAPSLMAFRGLCLMHTMTNRLNILAAAEKTIAQDEPFLRLCDQAQEHVEIVLDIFPSDSNNLLVAAQLAYTARQFRMASIILDRVLQLDPTNRPATEMQAYAKQYMAEFGQ